MLRYIDLGKYRKARVWLDELPPMPTGRATLLQRTLYLQCSSHQALRKAGLELFIPAGPSFLYGLLGATISEAAVSTFEVELRTLLRQDHIYSSSLAGSAGTAFWGLPGEYSEAVMNGVALALNQQCRLGAAKLSIGVAAFSAVGSNNEIFKRLGFNLVRLFSEASLESSDEIISRLCAVDR